MPDILYSRTPADDFSGAFPLGNGNLGCMICGGLARETIALNENTLWSGHPHSCANAHAREAIPEIRKAFFEGRYEDADRAAREGLLRTSAYRDGDSSESPFGAYLPLGELELFYDHYWIRKSRNYRRELDLETGICRVSFDLSRASYERAFFVSHPDSVLCIRMTAKGGAGWRLRIRLKREKDAEVPEVCGNAILLKGQVSGGRRFAAKLKIFAPEGEVLPHGDHLEVRCSHDFHILLAGATDFSGEDAVSGCEAALENAGKRPYDELLRRHCEDFRRYAGNVRLSLGDELEDAGNLDSFQDRVRDGSQAASAAALFFRYARYLLVSSVRGRLPLSLQGLWNGDYRPAWDCDYHLNCNTQIIYWPVEKVGLSGGMQPLLRWLKTLAHEGARAAKEVFGARGWCAAWISNPYGYAYPGKDLEWGLFPEAGAWMCRHIREHYEYTADREFLKEYFPLLRGACEFCLDMLAEDPATGKLLFGPTVPPEHGFMTENGANCFVAWGSACAQEIVYDLFDFTIQAADILHEDPDFRETAARAQARLALPEIVDGMIHPWIHPLKMDWRRHYRHTYGHVPGTRISLEKTPELIPALRKTIGDHEQFNGTGAGAGAGSWAGIWTIHHYAKLREGEKAWRTLNRLMRETVTDNLLTLNSGFFQADGIFGSLSGMADMLLQSHDGCLRLLPALPAAWKDGCVSGLRARGGFEVSMRWKDGRPTGIRIVSHAGGPCRIAAGELCRDFDTGQGETLLLDGEMKILRRES